MIIYEFLTNKIYNMTFYGSMLCEWKIYGSVF